MILTLIISSIPPVARQMASCSRIFLFSPKPAKRGKSKSESNRAQELKEKEKGKRNRAQEPQARKESRRKK